VGACGSAYRSFQSGNDNRLVLLLVAKDILVKTLVRAGPNRNYTSRKPMSAV